jgi:hypothetical protein
VGNDSVVPDSKRERGVHARYDLLGTRSAGSVAIGEEATFCAKLAPNSQKGAENDKHVEKETPRASRFIADSSPAANKAGMRVAKQRPRELWELPSGKGERGCVLVPTVPAKFFIQKKK